MSRVYHSACLERGQSYWDYENFRLSSLRWEDVDRYEVNGRLGFGRFSEVMEGIAVDSGRKVVLKVLKPARTYKVKREIRVLQASILALNNLPACQVISGRGAMLLLPFVPFACKPRRLHIRNVMCE